MIEYFFLISKERVIEIFSSLYSHSFENGMNSSLPILCFITKYPDKKSRREEAMKSDREENHWVAYPCFNSKKLLPPFSTFQPPADFKLNRSQINRESFIDCKIRREN